MQNISIKDIVKSTASIETKRKNDTKQDSSKTFSSLLNNTSKSQNSTSKKTEDTKEPLNESVEEVSDKAPKSEAVEKLVQFLINSDSSTRDNLDMDELKNLLSELLDGSLSLEAGNGGSGNGNQLLVFNLLNLQGVSSISVNSKEQIKSGIDMLAEQIASKLVSDSSFKEEFIANLKAASSNPTTENDNDFKQAILEKLASMLDNVQITELKHPTQENKETTEETLYSANKFDALSSDKSNFELRQEVKSLNKEDKLLKSLTDDSSSDNKDNLAGKISNVMVRFEAIRNDKATSQEAPIVINKSTFNADFIKAVKFMDLNNMKELSVKIIPKDLGEITIRLSMDNGVMKANITAVNKETYNLLNAQLPAISNQLAEQNMNIQSFSLSLYNGDNFLFNGDGSNEGDNRKQGKSSNRILAVDDEETVNEGYHPENNVNILA